jgi:hypothetical protein
MALGGMYDQIGGGFARYSVDATWTIPHFEKMLYDNAQLARTYTHAWQLWKEPLYERIATETLDYLLRDMLDEGGGFHSSEDADSEGVEGKFYVWSYDEFMAAAAEAAEYYGITERGNFEGLNNPTAASDDPPEEARAKLRELRARRVRPGKDDKVLASWNGLAIAAFAEAGAAFGRADFVDAARRAASFVLDTMRDGDRLLHAYRAGRAHITGFCEDYAFLADGLLALWDATFEPRWLEEAIKLSRLAIELFADDAGGFFTTAADAAELVVRQKEIIESATPAPGGVLSLVLQRLALLLDERDLARPAVDALRVARTYMERAAQAVPSWLSALDFYVSTPKEVAFTGPLSTDEGKELVGIVSSRFLPNLLTAGRGADGDHGLLEQIALLSDKPQTTVPTAYVCERFVCQAPTTDPAALAAQLDSP